MYDYTAEAKILKAVKGPVNFGEMHGTLRDRAVIPSSVPYLDVVDLISFPYHPEHEWIRIGYYIYTAAEDKLIWADKTAITEPVSQWRKILLKTAREKSWFRQLLEEVVDELRRA